MTTVKVISDDEIIISAVRFVFTTTRRYERIGDLWYNKKLHQQLTDYEMDNLPDEVLVFGKEKI